MEEIIINISQLYTQSGDSDSNALSVPSFLCDFCSI